MQEDFIVYLWQFQAFSKNYLQTAEGETVEIIRVGNLNKDAGADFQMAEILLDGIRWVGSAELHLRTSDWLKHRHQENKSYDTVILHIVWENDLPQNAILRSDKSPIPVLELKPLTDSLLLEKYHFLKNTQNPIPCSSFISQIPKALIASMLEKTLLGRLERKAAEIRQLLHTNKQDWEQTAYQVLAQNMGFKVNAEPFLALSKSLALKTIWKHTDQLPVVEALLLGQAGFLEAEPTDDYTAFLQREYRFFAYKYQLQPLKVEQWKFSKLRPPNFPTLRLAQLATLLQRRKPSFADMMEYENFDFFLQNFDIQTSTYWQEHYLLGKKSKRATGSMGKKSVENIVINTVVPLMVVFGQEKDNPQYLNHAIHILEQITPEKNQITEIYTQLGLTASNAFDSQAQIELYNEFCTRKRCLNCDLGVRIVRKM